MQREELLIKFITILPGKNFLCVKKKKKCYLLEAISLTKGFTYHLCTNKKIK